MGVLLQPGRELAVRHFPLLNESLSPTPIAAPPARPSVLQASPSEWSRHGPQARAGPRPGLRGRLPSAHIPIGWAAAERGEASTHPLG